MAKPRYVVHRCAPWWRVLDTMTGRCCGEHHRVRRDALAVVERLNALSHRGWR